ncbi:MAG: PQQ-binding-like beta-propeller repeat protein [Pirellulaceae bacterium]
MQSTLRAWNGTSNSWSRTAGVAVVAVCMFFALFWFLSSEDLSLLRNIESGGTASTVGAELASRVENEDWIQFGHSRGWIAAGAIAKNTQLVPLWEKEVGEGQSQVVGSKGQIFVASGYDEKPEGGGPRELTTSFAAFDVASGKELWKFQTKSDMLEDQETFGGNRPTPQATPLLLNGSFVGLAFTGELFCLNSQTGEEIWSTNLCEKFDADAVQFGFSASPAKAPSSSDSFVVLAAGQKGGLCKLNASSGDVIWRAPVATFSYATPVYAELAETPQWIVVSQDHVLGIEDRSGKELWKHELAKPGLTNVPCPLVVDDRRLIVSGQGVGGTKGLEIVFESGKWSAEESWFNRRLQFFYTNWTMLNSTIAIGCTEQYLTAFDVRSGEQLGRWRGYGDGNIVRLESELWILGGKGQSTVMHLNNSDSELTVDRKHELVDGRCWVAPSQIDGKWFVRSEKKLQCLAFVSRTSSAITSSPTEIENQIAPGDEEHLAMLSSGLPEVDPVEQIFELFESQGQVAAMTQYEKLRSEKKLSDKQHVALAEAAYQNGLKDLATLVMRHGQLDHPNSKIIKKKMAEWTGKPQ